MTTIAFIAFVVAVYAVYSAATAYVLLSMTRHPDRWPAVTALLDGATRLARHVRDDVARLLERIHR